jgi:protease secretion system outer membrane protein
MRWRLLLAASCAVITLGAFAQTPDPAQASNLAPVVAVAAQQTNTPTGAPGLAAAFEKAKRTDPLYLAGMAEFDGNKINAQAASAAYYPELAVGSSQLQNESGGRRNSLTLSQPLLNIDKLATWRSQEPKDLAASAQLAVRETDLARRLFAAYTSGVIALEGLAQNKARLSALDQQVKSARRLLELSRGTVTDVQDALVKFLRAKSDELRLRADLNAAQQLYMSIVGERPMPVAPALVTKKSGVSEALLGDVRRTVAGDESVLDTNPEVILARQQGKLAELEAFRAKYSWMPVVSGTYTASSLDGKLTTFTGVALTMPLQAGSYYATKSSAAAYVKVEQEIRDKERQVALNIDQLRISLQLGISELAARQTAVDAAELSVNANDKSFKGGVRTMVDVLNSIEVLYSVKNELLLAVLGFADKLLQLRLAEGKSGIDGLAEVERFLSL